MAAVFYIKRNDRGPAIEAILRGPDQAAIDLTAAASLKFIMLGKVDAAATIVDPTLGTVKYEWAANDTDTAGVYNAEFEITWNDGRKQTVPNRGYIKVYIDEDLG